MRYLLALMLCIPIASCDATSSSSDAKPVDVRGDDAVTADATEGLDATVEIADDAWGADVEVYVDPIPHPIGMAVPAFALEDLNPSSSTYGQLVDGADLAGTPYNLIFFDSRCPECGHVADAIWEAYQAHPGWWDAQPTFMIERYAAYEKYPGSATQVIDGNDLPYLLDTEDNLVWSAFMALNHDFFAIDASGHLATWLELYFFPEDMVKFTDYMSEQHGN